MKNLLLAGVFTAAFGAASAQSAVLTVDVFDNGTLVGTATSTSGSVADRITSDPAFDVIDLSASGVPFLPGGDLSSVTINVTSAAISTTHTLDIQVFQDGISVPAGHFTESTMTTNNLIGVPGPTTERTLINGTGTDISSFTTLVSHTFPLGTHLGAFGPISVFESSGITSDAHQYLLGFTHSDQSSNDTIQLTTGIPEPSTWAMMALGFGLLGFTAAWRKGKAPRRLIGIA